MQRACHARLGLDQVAALADLGEIEVDGAAGLIVTVLGTVCAFIGCCVPAVKGTSMPQNRPGSPPPPVLPYGGGR